ncbi:MAG TPA: hypothetical protein VFQ80_08635 [Thermomicrobiales bacterium]|nr:hypothetical protein [Thermomicrobiales bacterium]
MGITAIGEGAAGLFLLLLPAVPLALLLGLPATARETLLVARLGGAALIGIGAASGWSVRNGGDAAARGLLVGIVLYDILVAAVLVYAGIGLGFVGVLLWPAVAAHVGLFIWGIAGLRATAGKKRSPHTGAGGYHRS